MSFYKFTFWRLSVRSRCAAMNKLFVVEHHPAPCLEFCGEISTVGAKWRRNHTGNHKMFSGSPLCRGFSNTWCAGPGPVCPGVSTYRVYSGFVGGALLCHLRRSFYITFSYQLIASFSFIPCGFSHFCKYTVRKEELETFRLFLFWIEV